MAAEEANGGGSQTPGEEQLRPTSECVSSRSAQTH